jgi:hypothetical protein
LSPVTVAVPLPVLTSWLVPVIWEPRVNDPKVESRVTVEPYCSTLPVAMVPPPVL